MLGAGNKNGLANTHKYLALIRISLINRWAYRADVLARTTFIAIILFIFAQLWRQALPGKSTMAGFTAWQMVWYLLITESLVLAQPRLESAIADDVKSGNIAYQLVRPYSYIGYYMSRSLGEFLVRWPAHLVVGSLIAILLAGPPRVLPAAWPLAACSALLGACLSFMFTIGLALTAFWFEENRPFFWIYSKLIFTLGGLFMPVEVYPAALRAAARYTPFEYMVSGPARLFVWFDWGFFFRILAGQIVWLALLTLSACALYWIGVKRVHVQGG